MAENLPALPLTPWMATRWSAGGAERITVYRQLGGCGEESILIGLASSERRARRLLRKACRKANKLNAADSRCLVAAVRRADPHFIPPSASRVTARRSGTGVMVEWDDGHERFHAVISVGIPGEVGPGEVDLTDC